MYIGLAVIVVAIFAVGFFVFAELQKPSELDGFAQCLSDSGLIMAGTDWCHFCRQQKAMFGTAFKYIDYKNCDYEKAFCTENQVQGYPTWIDAQGLSHRGVQSLEELSAVSGCSLN